MATQPPAVPPVGAAALREALLGLIGDPIKTATGLSSDQLATSGRALYPEEGPEGTARNFPAHRLASRLLTQRAGAPIAGAAGIANEVIEALTRRAAGSEAPLIGGGEALIDVGDLGANVRGISEGILDSAITPQGTEALRRMLLAQAQRFLPPAAPPPTPPPATTQP